MRRGAVIASMGVRGWGRWLARHVRFDGCAQAPRGVEDGGELGVGRALERHERAHHRALPLAGGRRPARPQLQLGEGDVHPARAQRQALGHRGGAVGKPGLAVCRSHPAIIPHVPIRHRDAPPEESLYAPIEWESAHEYGDLLYEKGDGIAKISINRPEVRNAFRPQTLAELRDAFNRARDDTEVGSIIFTGAGDEAFCSGGDQRIRGDDGYIGDDEVAQKGVGRLDVGDLHVQIRRLPKPVVAMVAGYAVGGGHILHLVCDLTIAADNAHFGQTGPRVGSFDGGFGASLLANNIGVKRAKEIWFLCRLYDADEALQMGLVNKVVPISRARARDGRLVPRDERALPPLAPPLEVELQRHRGRPHRHPAALARRDAPLLHVRGGPGGPELLPGGSLAGLLEVPAYAL